LVEQLIRNQQVTRSSRVAGSKIPQSAASGWRPAQLRRFQQTVIRRTWFPQETRVVGTAGAGRV